MQDRPSVDELLEAVAGFLQDDVMAATTGRVNFHARVAANVIQMIRRELDRQEVQLEAEWEGLDRLLGPAARPGHLADVHRGVDSRNRELAERIQRGEADGGPFREQVVQHLRRVTLDKLAISNPALAAEAAKPA